MCATSRNLSPLHQAILAPIYVYEFGRNRDHAAVRGPADALPAVGQPHPPAAYPLAHTKQPGSAKLPGTPPDQYKAIIAWMGARAGPASEHVVLSSRLVVLAGKRAHAAGERGHVCVGLADGRVRAGERVHGAADVRVGRAHKGGRVSLVDASAGDAHGGGTLVIGQAATWGWWTCARGWRLNARVGLASGWVIWRAGAWGWQACTWGWRARMVGGRVGLAKCEHGASRLARGVGGRAHAGWRAGAWGCGRAREAVGGVHWSWGSVCTHGRVWCERSPGREHHGDDD
ncbi:hypothetical protein FIBSPDRAFT_885878 [Athelia psychrophila]|uniref:Uncharacterized protein n=1 Tax=Athelia psychrophila TaxID=1759441 RepID=A0A166RII6_9AGAM|nr:hypothetical protein FIBSPDRAFT_885878 [Fibularhizoctonia sp. CBS 109695]